MTSINQTLGWIVETYPKQARVTLNLGLIYFCDSRSSFNVSYIFEKLLSWKLVPIINTIEFNYQLKAMSGFYIWFKNYQNKSTELKLSQDI